MRDHKCGLMKKFRNHPGCVTTLEEFAKTEAGAGITKANIMKAFGLTVFHKTTPFFLVKQCEKEEKLWKALLECVQEAAHPLKATEVQEAE